ncbi:MAG: HipA domain-containing protein [Clostridiales bacterium]|nr:HipA domain-containing protein [Clostridiales bacterium]
MIDFNDGEEKLNKFLGLESKTTVVYNGEVYMLKFPDPVLSRKSKDVLRYKYNQFSEHIGSSIFSACGFAAQETALGYFADSFGKSCIVVGCKDFTQNGDVLYEFSKIANQITSSIDKLFSSIENVTFIIQNSKLLKNKDNIIDSFWDMFVIDALIGNDDRHFDNWGVLEKVDGSVVFAPIYDCGSSLSAAFDDAMMTDLLSSHSDFEKEELHLRSSYSVGGKRVQYYDIFNEPPDSLSKAVARTVPKINMDSIIGIVQSVDQISDVRKGYLEQAMSLRYERMLLPALGKTSAPFSR